MELFSHRNSLLLHTLKHLRNILLPCLCESHNFAALLLY